MKRVEACAGIVTGAVSAVVIIIVVCGFLRVLVHTIEYEVIRQQTNYRMYVSDSILRMYRDGLQRGLQSEEASVDAIIGDAQRGAKW